MRYAEIHIHDDSLQTRHCFTDYEPFRIHPGFTFADMDAGWRQTKAFFADRHPDLHNAIELAKVESLEHLRSYWESLAKQPVERVIHKGQHFVIHELGLGIGFGGRAFTIEWLDADRPPTTCNLSSQGRVPSWMRDKLPDNARVIHTLDYCVPDEDDDDRELYELPA